ncbi:MAG TPA: CRISPR system precrRNA processing endoribonuclease RAMP protein Cas6 [Actinomycetaceae bacterium]|nr:CRISPR system precrRNA processing endoribonuclease RAMP protein Cas6 [Actinomycetaceae bacterium]
MPSRYEVHFTGVTARDVQLTHLHAAISRVFDHDTTDHIRNVKPYSIAAPRPEGHSGIIIEIGVLTDIAETRLLKGIPAGRAFRFGRDIGQATAVPRLLGGASWAQLSDLPPARRWSVRFLTPTTFRDRDRSSPLPAPSSALRGLTLKWNALSGLAPIEHTGEQTASVWVSDIEGRSVPLDVGGRILSGFVGESVWRCDNDAVAPDVGRLLAMAQFSGIGSATAKGFGTVRVRPHALRAAPASETTDHEREIA